MVLVVNTASKCGFTPQFGGLEKLYKDMKEKHGDDFTIIGFPCNQFGGQGTWSPKGAHPSSEQSNLTNMAVPAYRSWVISPFPFLVPSLISPLSFIPKGKERKEKMTKTKSSVCSQRRIRGRAAFQNSITGLPDE